MTAPAVKAVDAACMAGSLPRRPREGHKGTFGHVQIFGGSVGFTGAPVLAALGALRTGAGLVSVAVPQEVWPIVAQTCLCAMAAPLPQGGAMLPAMLDILSNRTAALIGPGMGRDPQVAQAIRGVIRKAPCPLVVDADGINALAAHIDVLAARRDKVTVLTPHGGEFARLLGRPVADPLADGLAFSAQTGCVLVLKGHRTLTLLPDGRAFRNTTGNPGMATGGSGDVLAGVILALLGQGFSPEKAAYGGVYLHGLAGDLAAARLGEYSLTAGDLPDFLPAALLTATAP